uniref:Uncharacterized protein n=1 Tax=Picea glauca TaxID=3330 RepID=A0A101M5D3_PICGL|nr:hypothetical protein ABT39_MTgene1272 [Picea glauca]QHR88264.1 hypothetical protein Q903MT_gene2277 [Picea sitchensis]
MCVLSLPWGVPCLLMTLHCPQVFICTLWYSYAHVPFMGGTLLYLFHVSGCFLCESHFVHLWH